jgi:hypothetical protein
MTHAESEEFRNSQTSMVMMEILKESLHNAMCIIVVRLFLNLGGLWGHGGGIQYPNSKSRFSPGGHQNRKSENPMASSCSDFEVSSDTAQVGHAIEAWMMDDGSVRKECRATHAEPTCPPRSCHCHRPSSDVM